MRGASHVDVDGQSAGAPSDADQEVHVLSVEDCEQELADLSHSVNHRRHHSASTKEDTCSSEPSPSLSDSRDGELCSSPTTKRSARPPPNPQSKVLFLDGLRGLAAILVVMQHAGYSGGGSAEIGQCGVDIFFILSAFLLTMLFYKKSEQLLAQRATCRRWGFALADYVSKRFLRVYPLFVIVAVAVWLLSDKDKQHYFAVGNPKQYDLFKVLTFEFKFRYHVFWTLPLEIAYYFLIPVFVAIALGLGRAWWLPCGPLFHWVWCEGWTQLRADHMPLKPHLPTFVWGSLAALLYLKIDAAIKRHAFSFARWHVITIRALECVIAALLLSEFYRSLMYDWIPKLPRPNAKRSHFISPHVTALIVIEMLLPSALAAKLEMSSLRFVGKISFSIYLLHSFVVYAPWIGKQRSPANKLACLVFCNILLATVSYYIIEYPCQLLSARISRALAHKCAPNSARKSEQVEPLLRGGAAEPRIQIV